MPIQAAIKPNTVLPKHLAVPIAGTSSGSASLAGTSAGSVASTTVLARYTSTYQTTNVAAATYADVELNAETAVTESADVTTSPFVYTAPTAQTVDVSASMRYADSEHIVRTVFAINVNDADAEAVFVPIVRGGYGYMSVSTRLSLLTSDTVKVIARAYNADASSQELLIDQQEIIITTT